MDCKRSEKHAIAATVGKGGPAKGNPTPQHDPLTTTRISRSSSTVKINNITCAPDDEIIQQTNYTPSMSCCAKTMIGLFGVALPAAIFCALLFMLIMSPFKIPSLPGFSVTSVSTTVRNTTVDMDVSFHVANQEDNGMAFDHLRVSSMNDQSINNKITIAGDLPPFLLDANDKKTMRFTLNDVPFPTDALVGDDDEIITNYNNSCGQGKSRFWNVQFGLKGNVTYRGETWSRRRVPILVSCDGVNVILSSESTQTIQIPLDADDISKWNCKVAGLWERTHDLCDKVARGLLIFFYVYVLLFWTGIIVLFLYKRRNFLQQNH